MAILLQAGGVKVRLYLTVTSSKTKRQRTRHCSVTFNSARPWIPGVEVQWGHLRPSAMSFTVVKHSNSQSRIQEVESCESGWLPLTVKPDNDLHLCRVIQALMMKSFTRARRYCSDCWNNTLPYFIFSISCLFYHYSSLQSAIFLPVIFCL